ncbi:hypothetical protein [Cellulomonas soli]
MSAPTEIRTSVIRVPGHQITVRRTALRPDDDPTGPRACAPVDPTDTGVAPSPTRPTLASPDLQEP